MKAQIIAVVLLAIVCLVLFTSLLLSGHISAAVYAVLLGGFAVVCITLLVLPRLRELDLKNLRLVLNEIKQVKEDIAEVYGGIENLRKQPLVLDKAKMRELGLKGGALALDAAVMRYGSGCITRERERLASVFVREKTPEQIAQGILDNSLDDKVFKWAGPEMPLDAEPKTAEQREKEKKAKSESAEPDQRDERGA